jgi:hypothetical protein
MGCPVSVPLYASKENATKDAAELNDPSPEQTSLILEDSEGVPLEDILDVSIMSVSASQIFT